MRSGQAGELKTTECRNGLTSLVSKLDLHVYHPTARITANLKRSEDRSPLLPRALPSFYPPSGFLIDLKFTFFWGMADV